MNKDVPESLIKKIQKCLALSQSPNENEAALAAQMAQELLTKYNLSMADVEVKNEKTGELMTDFVSKGTSDRWKINLMGSVARCNFCSMIMNQNYKGHVTFILIGKVHNIEVAKQIFGYLVDAMDAIWKLDARDKVYAEVEANKLMHEIQNGGELTPARYRHIKRIAKDSWRLGIASGLGERLKERKRQAESEGLNNGNGSDCTALAVQSLYKQEMELNKQHLAEQHPNLRNAGFGNRRINGDAYGQGQNDSLRVGLNPQVDGSGNRKNIS